MVKHQLLFSNTFSSCIMYRNVYLHMEGLMAFMCQCFTTCMLHSLALHLSANILLLKCLYYSILVEENIGELGDWLWIFQSSPQMYMHWKWIFLFCFVLMRHLSHAWNWFCPWCWCMCMICPRGYINTCVYHSYHSLKWVWSKTCHWYLPKTIKVIVILY